MKTTSLALMLLGLSLTCKGYWRPTPFEELATNSDYVVVGEVKALAADAKTQRVKVTLHILESVKGKAAVGDDLVFEAPFSLHPDVRSGLNLLGSFASNKVYGVFLMDAPRKVPWSEPWATLKPNPHPEEVIKKYTVSNMTSGAINYISTSGAIPLSPGEIIVKTNFHDPFANDAGGSRTIHAERAEIPYHSIPIQMTKEDDGVLIVDWEQHLFHHGIKSDPVWKPLSDFKDKCK
jgi:hypothetical protein